MLLNLERLRAHCGTDHGCRAKGSWESVMVSNSISRFMKDTSGVTSIEYGLIAAIVAVGIVVSVTLLGDNLKASYDDTASRFT